MFVSHQFLAWAGLHVIGVRVSILQRVATLETRRQDTLMMENVQKSDCVRIYQHDLYSTTSLVQIY